MTLWVEGSVGLSLVGCRKEFKFELGVTRSEWLDMTQHERDTLLDQMIEEEIWNHVDAYGDVIDDGSEVE